MSWARKKKREKERKRKWFLQNIGDNIRRCAHVLYVRRLHEWMGFGSLHYDGDKQQQPATSNTQSKKKKTTTIKKNVKQTAADDAEYIYIFAKSNCLWMNDDRILCTSTHSTTILPHKTASSPSDIPTNHHSAFCRCCCLIMFFFFVFYCISSALAQIL